MNAGLCAGAKGHRKADFISSFMPFIIKMCASREGVGKQDEIPTPTSGREGVNMQDAN